MMAMTSPSVSGPMLAPPALEAPPVTIRNSCGGLAACGRAACRGAWRHRNRRRCTATRLPLWKRLDCAGGEASVNLLADQRVWNGVIERIDFNMIVDAHADQLPLGIFIFCVRQPLQRRPLEALEQIGTADAELAHRARVHIRHRDSHGRIGFVSEKKVWLRSRPRI